MAKSSPPKNKRAPAGSIPASSGSPAAPRHVHFLDTTTSPLKEDVGGKGFHLIQMAQLSLPVPDAAVLDTGLWKEWKTDPVGIETQLRDVLVPAITARLRASAGGVFPHVSVRSSGAVSMPGMMDTILNVGVTEGSMIAAIRSSADPEAEERFQADCYTRFLTMYGTSVLGIPEKALKPLRKITAEVSELAASGPSPKKKGSKKASVSTAKNSAAAKIDVAAASPADLAPYTLLARVASEGERIYSAHNYALPSSRPEEQIVQ
jgi:hypothetical protein